MRSAPPCELDNLGAHVDPSTWPILLVVLLIAVIAGAIFGAVGAASNRVKNWDEFLLWVIGGAVGGALAVLGWTGILFGICALFEFNVTIVPTATTALIIFAAAALPGAVVSTLLDGTDHPGAWLSSFLIKWVQSPLLTSVGLLATLIVVITGNTIDFRRGMLFIAVGPGRAALTLGAVAWSQSGCFNPDGTMPDNLAQHESMHSRTVAAIGELGFYVTYVTVGAIWGLAQGGGWNSLNAIGCGNPFEKTAHTFTNNPVTPRSASNC
jgi:hypothetical protein